MHEKKPRQWWNTAGANHNQAVRQTAAYTTISLPRPAPKGRRELMANHMKPEKRLQLLRLLCEGNSIRSTARLCGTNIRTVLRHLVIAGEECRQFLHQELREIEVNHVQCDEIWTFVGKKQGRLSADEKSNSRIGDQFLYVALEQDTKLICTYAIGKRDKPTTDRFIEDLARRIIVPDYPHESGRPQVSTDGWGAYPDAIASSFGRRVDYGQLIKNYGDQSQEGRYGPPDVVATDRRPIWGVENVATICTSHVERCNLTIRTFLKRFTRLSLGFSKKLDNLKAAVALHVFHYNFCRVHGTLKRTPALAAGVADRLWKLDDLFG